MFYVNDFLEKLMFEELKHHSASQGMDLYVYSLSVEMQQYIDISCIVSF